MNFNSQVEEEMIKASNWVYEYLKKGLEENQNKGDFKVFKPMPSPIDKIQNRYRWRIIIKGNRNEEANQILNQCLKEVYSKNLKSTRITVDVNPNNMM